MAHHTTTIRVASLFTCDRPRCPESIHFQERFQGEIISSNDLEPGYASAVMAQDRRDSDLENDLLNSGWSIIASNGETDRHMCPKHRIRYTYPDNR